MPLPDKTLRLEQELATTKQQLAITNQQVKALQQPVNNLNITCYHLQQAMQKISTQQQASPTLLSLLPPVNLLQRAPYENSDNPFMLFVPESQPPKEKMPSFKSNIETSDEEPVFKKKR